MNDPTIPLDAFALPYDQASSVPVADARDFAPQRRPDGRNRRSQRSRAACLAACRSFMQTGNFRPSMTAITKAAGVSIRTGFQHFLDIDLLRVEAANDETTARVIASLALGADVILLSDTALKRMVRALILGGAK